VDCDVSKEGEHERAPERVGRDPSQVPKGRFELGLGGSVPEDFTSNPAVTFPDIRYGTSCPSTPRPSDRRYETSYLSMITALGIWGIVAMFGFLNRTAIASSAGSFTTAPDVSTSDLRGAPPLTAAMIRSTVDVFPVE
jgi:hypothetical protein